MTIVKQPKPSQAIWVVPLKDILDDLPLFEVAEKRGFSKHQVLSALVGVADGLLNNDVNHCAIFEFLKNTLPQVPGHSDLMDMVIDCAGRLVRMAPSQARELLYLTSRSGDLPKRKALSAGVERVSIFLKMGLTQ